MAQQSYDDQPKKEIDISRSIRYLTHTFNQATSKMDRPWRNTKTGQSNALYMMQREFAYRLNEIVMAPRSVTAKAIADCNAYIDFAMTNSSDKR